MATRSDSDDYYSILGVSKSADADEIKKAYRRMAMKYHPDKLKGDKDSPENKDKEAHFKKVGEAYAILSDPEKRQAYDRFGKAGVDQAAAAAAQANAAENFHSIFSNIFGDFFDDSMGGMGRGSHSRVMRGSDLRYNLELGLEEAVAGSTVNIKLSTLASCKPCNGSGAKDGAKPVTCTTCHGQGQVRMQQGFFSIQQPCPSCGGSGQIIKDYCTKCRGEGRVHESKTLSVKVPAGVDNGDRIRLSGEGEAGPQGGPAGDLYVQIHLKKHEIFTRDDTDLHCEVPVSFATLALGGEIEVPTLNGRVKLKIPAETQSGKLFRLRGKGIKNVRGHGPGDCLCRVMVEVPVNLNAKQKELLTTFAEIVDAEDKGRHHTPVVKTWLSRVRSFFEEMNF